MARAIQYLLGPGAGWRDGAMALVDVAIVAYLCYRVLVLIRGTRAVQVLTGLFVLGLAYLGSQALGLVTVNWLLGHFLTYSIFFGIIVLFQADIRRALAQLGRGGALARLFRADHAAQLSAVDAVARAAAELSRRRIGALVVLERAADLLEVAESGVPLDARVSPEMLRALFHPGGPVHDGAVLVRDGRVVAARCFLPLSQAHEAGDLGTRHRAALGLAEEVDAAVVVVSEERGEISLAADGALERGLDEPALRARLQEIFAVRPRRRGAPVRIADAADAPPAKEPHAAV